MAGPDARVDIPADAEEPLVRPLERGLPSPPVDRPRIGGVGVTIALVGAALVAGFLLGTGSVRGRPEPLTRLGVVAETTGLAAAIEGLQDTLLVVATNGGRAMDVVMWPPSGALTMRPAPIAWTAVTIDGFPFEDFAAFDSSGRYVALTAPVAAESSAVLMAGRLEEQVVVATGVTGYAWHTSEPHQLALSIEDQGTTTIHVMLGAPMSLSPVMELPDGARLLAWLRRGYLISLGGEEQGYVGWASGGANTSATFDAEFLGAGPDVVVAAADTEDVIVFDAVFGDVEPLQVEFHGDTAAVEPDTRRIAIGGPEGLLVVTAEGARIAEIEHPFVERLDWSSDGRFIVFADRVDVLVLDLETGELTATGLGPSEAVMFRPPAG